MLKTKAVTTRVRTTLGDVHATFLDASNIVVSTLLNSGEASTGALQLKSTRALASLVLRADEGWAPRGKEDIWLITDTEHQPLGPLNRKAIVTAVRAGVLELLESTEGQDLLVTAETNSLIKTITTAQDKLADPDADHASATAELEIAQCQLSALS